MESFLISTVVAGLSEFGDKTQVLALILASRFRKPAPIMLGMVGASLFSHLFAGSLGLWLANHADPMWLQWTVGCLFMAIAVWVATPYRGFERLEAHGHASIFLISLGSFFFAELGDKTQIATVALAARYQELAPVVIGATLGMMLVDIPTILLANRSAARLPVRAVRLAAAAVFAGLGFLTLLEASAVAASSNRAEARMYPAPAVQMVRQIDSNRPIARFFLTLSHANNSPFMAM